MKRTRSADGVDLAWQEEGDGPGLVLVHSLGAHSGMWSAQAAALATRYRVVRVDLRGHGASGAPAGPYAIETLGEDVLAVADAADLRQFHLAGISLGGQVALWAATQRPERLLSVILSNTAARIGSAQGWNERIRAVRAEGLGSVSRMVVGGWFSDGFGDVERRRRAIAMFEATDPEGYVGCCAALANADLRAGVAGVSVPTLIIAGQFDRSTPLADAEWLHSRIPDSRLEVMEGCAHLPPLERPDRYSALLASWLDGVSARSVRGVAPDV